MGTAHAVGFCAALWLLAGCGGAPSARAPASAGGASDTVAWVAGRPITAEAVARQARASASGREQALRALIDAELLAAEAERRGLAAAPEVKEAVAAAMVRRLLQTGFERDVTPAQVTEAELRTAYVRNSDELDRPEMRLVDHVLVPFPPGPADEAQRLLLRRRAEEVARRARSVAGPEAFLALATALSDDAVRLKGEELATGAVGFTVKPFADAVFALPRAGALSDVVETRFGYHVIYLKEVIPPRQVPLDAVREKLRAGVFPEVRRRAFARLVDGLTEGHRVELHPDRLETAGER